MSNSYEHKCQFNYCGYGAILTIEWYKDEYVPGKEICMLDKKPQSQNIQ